MTVDEMSCAELVETITQYLDGALPAIEQSRFERHLAQCAGCENYLDQMRTTIGALRAICVEELHAEQRTRLLDLFHDWQRA